LCRAIHASPLTLAQVANGIGVTLLELDQFLTGEHGLQSDTMDRLAKKLGFELKRCG
jgi:plasmid maintenance system antidote protein VapI